MCSKGRLAPKPDAASLGPLSAFTGSRQYQMALKLSETAQHRQHQSAMSRGRIAPRITKGLECCTSLGDLGGVRIDRASYVDVAQG